MNIIEALKSGKRVKRKDQTNWWQPLPGTSEHYGFTTDELLAEDWEIEETKVQISTAQFWEAYATALKLAEDTALFTKGRMCHFPNLLAQELGLEPKP